MEWNSEYLEILAGEFERVKGSPAAIVHVIREIYPGFDLEGLLPAFRTAAAKHGLHASALTLREPSGAIAIYVLASVKTELTVEDIAALIPGYAPLPLMPDR